MSNNITLIGLPSSGKTVFLSVFANTFSSRDDSDFWLEPMDNKTAEFVHKNMLTLKNRSWPRLTEAGLCYDLDWDLHYKNNRAIFRSFDVNGETWRRFVDLYGDRHKKNPSPDQMKNAPVHLKKVVDSLQKSVCIIALMDIKKIIDGPCEYIDTHSSLALIQFLEHHRKLDRLAFIIPKIDKLKSYYSECNNSWASVIKKFSPHTYQYIQDKKIPFFPISAVQDQELSENNKWVPKPNFKSEGLHPLMKHIANKIEKNNKGFFRSLFRITTYILFITATRPPRF